MMRKSVNNPYIGSTVTFPEPLDAIRRPGVRLCVDDPVEVATSVSQYCVPVYTLSRDIKLTSLIESYAIYCHEIKGHCVPSVVVSYVTLPRFVLAIRVEPLIRSLVLSSPLSISEG